MSDKPIVTHADLEALRNLRAALYSEPEDCRHMFEETPEMTVIDRLIAAAEADAPPLPEGWVLFADPDKQQSRVFWHSARGDLSVCSDEIGYFAAVGRDIPRDHLTPLRPTITEADVGKAADIIRDTHPDQTSVDVATDIFRALGIEVSKP